MDEIRSQIDNLTELSDEQLGSLETDITNSFDTFENAETFTAESVDHMTELADALDSVRSEYARREAQAAELSARAAELSARVKGSPEETVEAPAEAEAAAEEAPVEETPAAVEASAGPDEEKPEDDEKTEEDEDEPKKDEFSTTEPAPAEEPAVEAEEPVVEETSTEAPAEEETPAPEAPAEDAAPAEPTEGAEFSEASVAESQETVAEASAEAPVEAEASIEETTTDEQPAQEEAHTVTASAQDVPADRRPLAQENENIATVSITAGADLPGVSAGNKISDMGEVANLFEKRLRSLSRVNGGDGEQVIVASIQSEYNEAHTLDGTPEENWRKVSEAKENGSLVASGGFGTPLETRYDIFGFGDNGRPVRDSLPKFQADRGGIRFVKPPVLSSYADAVGVWTVDDDIAAASNSGIAGDTVKNSLTVAGAVEDSALLDAVTLQLKVGNLLSRAYPELVARHNELALIQHAREAEINILGKIEAKSTAVTTPGGIGVARDFLVNVRRSATAYRSRHRIAVSTQLQAIIPTWVVDAIAADLALNMPGDNKLSVARSEIYGYLAALNVTLTESPDQNYFGAQPAGPLLEFPDQFTWYLFSEGSFLFLDGGTLDIGIVRDSGLVNTNDYKMFVETFEGLAFVGIESLAITSTISVNGTAAALATPVEY